jgi:hypothetical protein
VKPGRLAQGPDEKFGIRGRMSGLVTSAMWLSLSEEKRPGGGA